MKHVTILALYDVVSASIVDARTIFTGVNEFLLASGREPAFTVDIVGMEKQVTLSDGVFSVHTSLLLKDLHKTDLVIIPAIGGDIAGNLEKNKAYLSWIREQYANGAEVASLSVIDNNGKLAFKKSIYLFKGTNQHKIDMSRFASGAYQVVVTTAKGDKVFTVVKQ